MTEQELIFKANSLSGLTASALASRLGCSLPTTRLHAKGWLGQALEKLLGATAGSRPLPDFVELGIELKTLPINLKGEPKESTYICIAPIPNPDLFWEHSLLHLKTRKILWIPILSDPNVPFAESRVLTPLLWEPTPAIEAILKQDWQELTEALNLGRFSTLNAYHGQWLQIRPKAANSQVLIEALDENANRLKTVPKGFYFRRLFTLELIRTHYQF